ncbi:hypothetical protein DFH07DRAFT_778196 [Mycena maculata]|uniref:Uncharacterized protein n=1 Tax=Mycena maculata TaxID=230809 RepID=A0AAD7IED4_9AGAR|nr:hypothetical protein DFH07DRAFT_778196 [Mycena maculata]
MSNERKHETTSSVAFLERQVQKMRLHGIEGHKSHRRTGIGGAVTLKQEMNHDSAVRRPGTNEERVEKITNTRIIDPMMQIHSYDGDPGEICAADEITSSVGLSNMTPRKRKRKQLPRVSRRSSFAAAMESLSTSSQWWILAVEDKDKLLFWAINTRYKRDEITFAGSVLSFVGGSINARSTDVADFFQKRAIMVFVSVIPDKRYVVAQFFQQQFVTGSSR